MQTTKLKSYSVWHPDGEIQQVFDYLEEDKNRKPFITNRVGGEFDFPHYWLRLATDDVLALRLKFPNLYIRPVRR